ncbi:MAG: glycosyltransferase family 87 protein [Candidatus Aminicenantaceae bacterium]
MKKDMSDFGVCYQGGERILKGETLYQVSDGHLQYKYSPVSAVFFSLFAFLPYELAKIFWYFLQLYFLFMALTISYNILPLKLKKKGSVLVLSFLILAKFVSREIELGQVNIFITFILIMMLKALLEKKDIKAGLFWGFSLFFKPYALVFLPYFILKKRLKLIGSGFGVIFLGIVLPVFFYGLKQYMFVLKEWYTTLSQSTPQLLTQYDNASIHAFFLKNLPADNGNLVLIFILCAVFLIGFSFLWMMYLGNRENSLKPEVLESSFLFILIPLISPLAWYYNYLYSLLAVVFLLNFIGKFPKVHRYIIITNLIIIGGSLIEVLGKAGFRFYTQHSLVVISYLVALFYLFYARVKIRLDLKNF